MSPAKMLLQFAVFCFLLSGGKAAMGLQIESPAFQEGGGIPQKYTCDGEDLSPPLSWQRPPKGTQSYVLIVDDPDAPVGTWVHWVIYNVPPGTQNLVEGISKMETHADGTQQGTNDFRRVGYGGPCPPPGPAHRYFFKLYALDTTLPLSSQAQKSDVLIAAKGHILAKAELVGLYQREK